MKYKPLILKGFFTSAFGRYIICMIFGGITLTILIKVSEKFGKKLR